MAVAAESVGIKKGVRKTAPLSDYVFFTFSYKNYCVQYSVMITMPLVPAPPAAVPVAWANILACTSVPAVLANASSTMMIKAALSLKKLDCILPPHKKAKSQRRRAIITPDVVVATH